MRPSEFQLWHVNDKALVIAFLRSKALMQSYDDYVNAQEMERQSKRSKARGG